MNSDALLPLKHIHGTRLVQLLIMVVFGATVINGIVYILHVQQNQESLRKRQLNEKAMVITRQLIGAIKNAETGSRGYMITQREKYILPYSKAIKEILPYQIELTRLIEQHFGKGELADVKLLNTIIHKKLADLSLMVELKNQEKDREMLLMINSDRSENDMNTIRNTCNRLMARFYENIDKEEKKVSETLIAGEISITLFSVVIIAGMGFMLSKLLEGQRKNVMLFDQLQAQNTKLVLQQQELKGLSMDFSARNAELEHFTHIISHDLRGPLNNMIALMNIISDEQDPVKETPEFKMLKSAGSGLYHKLDDLIILLRKKKDGNMLREIVTLSELLDEVRTNYKMEIERAGTRIDADFTEANELLSVKIYMQSILQNLISNGIKYRDPQRDNVISLKSWREDGHIKLRIADNGKGIDLNKFGKDIFGLFKTFHTDDDSHGVGLYLVKKQILEMNGSIDVESEAGEHTTFTISIPV